LNEKLVAKEELNITITVAEVNKTINQTIIKVILNRIDAGLDNRTTIDPSLITIHSPHKQEECVLDRTIIERIREKLWVESKRELWVES
jgi:hypothetical protein